MISRNSPHGGHTLFAAEQGILDSSSLTGAAGMDSCPCSAGFPSKGPDGTESSYTTKPDLAGLRSLNSHGLPHDGAAASNGLQIGHAATAGRGMAGGSRGRDRGRERSQGGRRGLLQERTHRLRLSEEGVHDREGLRLSYSGGGKIPKIGVRRWGDGMRARSPINRANSANAIVEQLLFAVFWRRGRTRTRTIWRICGGGVWNEKDKLLVSTQ